MEPSNDADWLRQRLISIEDELRTIADSNAAARYELMRAADACRNMLRAGNAEALEAARQRWTSRAANKDSHEQNVAALEALARFMPGEGGR